MAGRVAPFIELGVGFNPELTARENVVLNGVLMGLAAREARARLDAMLDFAELRDFVDLKLKNYSSGMMVRLAFAVMVQADADIMLVDEVLAVGDAAFAQKCIDVFHAKRRAGKTLVLVTHDMATVQSVLRPGDADPRRRAALPRRPRGDGAALLPAELRAATGADTGPRPAASRTSTCGCSTPWLEDAAGERDRATSSRASRSASTSCFEARRDLEAPMFGFHVLNEDGIGRVRLQRAR